MASVGDGTIEIDVTNTGGKTVRGIFVRAIETGGLPALGPSRTGDGALTFTDLENRVPYIVQTAIEETGGLGIPSKPLLLTPRVSGTSDYDSIRLEIQAELLQVANIGRIHLVRRHTTHWAEIYERHKKNSRLNNWEITRPSRLQEINAVEASAGAEPLFLDSHTILIRGHMAVNDKNDNETTFQQILDDIVLRIRLNNRLNNAVLLPRQMQVPTIDYETFGGTLCHFAELMFDAVVRVGG